MHQFFKELEEQIIYTNNILDEGIRLLNVYDKYIVANHSKCVAAKAEQLAIRFGEKSDDAKLAGVLHDISVIIPNDIKIDVAESLNIDILREEREFPFIIHQKLSSKIAENIFKIKNSNVLSAISCHTTLRANPTKLEMILFIADKLEWDRTGTPPYLSMIQEGLKDSLEAGVFTFIKYLYKDKSNLKVLHPYLVDAYNYLNKRLG